jgi:hypothetical protein
VQHDSLPANKTGSLQEADAQWPDPLLQARSASSPVLVSGVVQPFQDNDKADDKEVSHVKIHYSTGGNLF